MDQRVMKEQLAPVLNLLERCPVGEKVPSAWNAPVGYELEKMDVNGVMVEHLIPNERNGKIIIQLHGGGFLMDFLDCYRDIACMYSQAAEGAEIYSVDYRLAPGFRFPCALNDSIEVYKWLLEKEICSKNIIITGDSAGGNLVLAMTLQIKDQELPLPKAIIAISPWANLEGGYKAREDNFEKDLFIGKYGLKEGTLTLDPSFYTEPSNFSNPYVSPVYGDYTGFPDLLLQAGAYDLVVDDTRAVAAAAKEKGVNVKLTVYEEMSHVFQLLLPELEETKSAWQEIRDFLCKEFDIPNKK